jgi:hypothetical protein
VYLSSGVGLLLVVDPEGRTIAAYEPGAAPRFFTGGETFATPSFPGLTIDLTALFAELDLP